MSAGLFPRRRRIAIELTLYPPTCRHLARPDRRDLLALPTFKEFRRQWRPRPESNRRPSRYEGAALPSELQGRLSSRPRTCPQPFESPPLERIHQFNHAPCDRTTDIAAEEILDSVFGIGFQIGSRGR